MRSGTFFIICSLLLVTMVHASNDTLALEEEEVEEGDEAGEGEGLMLGEVEGDPEQQEVGDEEEEDEEEEDMQLVNLEDNIVDTGRRRGETSDSFFSPFKVATALLLYLLYLRYER